MARRRGASLSILLQHVLSSRNGPISGGKRRSSSCRRRGAATAAIWTDTSSPTRGYKLGAIDYMTVEQIIADRVRAGLSPKMVRGSVSVLSLILKCAVKAGARRDNPAEGHDIPMRRRKIREGDVLDMSQLHRLVANVRDPYKPEVWVLALAGLRPAELCGLRVRDVDFVRHVITVRATRMPGPQVRGRALPNRRGATPRRTLATGP